MDFSLNIAHSGEIKILQITDMQLIDGTQRRTPDRLSESELERWVPENDDVNIYNHIKYLIKETEPDLILITGDIIYGEFDDSGKVFVEFTEFMDSFEIPWAPIFGNHDNESYKGIDWQCEQFENAKYSLFKRGTVSGNGNYTIGIYQNGTLQRVIFMMDSNGCGKLGIKEGFRDDQLEWIETQSTKIHEQNPNTPFFICCHIPTAEFMEAYIKAGYMTGYDKSWLGDFTKFEIGVDVESNNGDFGRKYEGVTSLPPSILPLLKKCGFDGYFVGHYHEVNTSMLYEGIRLTFGLKTGYFDYYDPESTGGTLIKLNNRDFTVEHIYYK